MVNNDDKYENFVKETWSNLKFAIALVISLIIIFGLGAYYSVIQEGVNFAYGFIFWVLATIASIGISVLIIFIIREYKINHFWKWGDSWKNEAFNTLQFLQKTAAKENYIIFSPKDYSELLDVTRKENSTEEIQNIYLLGSMTGFLLLLPISLRNHICITNGNVTIDIIGSTEKTGTEKYQNLKSYPIAFVVKTMILLLECCSKFKTKNQTITFNLYHFPFDIMEALFIIGDKKLVNVQSLDPNNIDIIFENQQIGVLLSSEKNNEQFVRYRDTYSSVKLT
ncbi:MAG: hypothetical protein K9J84_14895 [Bacteroidia bacterium]|nr:hypothetical protein [Bacteroidia bacterium]